MNLAESPLAVAPLSASTLPERAVVSLPRANFLSDFVQLLKPRLTVMVLFTVGIGYLAGAAQTLELTTLLNVLFGTLLVACGASALNQLMEKDTDGRMRRTRNRPLPAGRLADSTVLRIGVALSCAGLVYLGLLVDPVVALVAAVTLGSYVFAYTPLKRYTSFNTLVGAIPGALPPVIGYVAATGRLDMGAVALFLILFCWQFPHFWAIAWLYRQDYARAGLQMLSVQDSEGGRLTGRLMVQSCLVLLVVSLIPATLGMAGPRYCLTALVLGLVFMLASVRFLLVPDQGRARQVLWASLAYLPVLLTVLLLDGPYLVLA